MTTIILVFRKIESKDKAKYANFYSSSKPEATTNESDIVNVFQSIYTALIENVRKSSSKNSWWIIDSVIDHTICISKYDPLTGSNYMKLPKELGHPRKR